MPVNPDDPTLVLTCADQGTPDVHADQCAPVLNLGPMVNILFAAQPFAAVPTAVEVARRLDLPLTDPESITMMIGTLSQAAQQAQTLRFNGADIPRVANLTWAIKSSDTHQKNVDFARSTQRTPWVGHVYGIDQNNNWYGGQNGIGGGQARVRLSNILPEDENAAQTIEGELKARGFYDAKRMPSPIPAVFG